MCSIHQQILEKYLNFCLFKCKKVVINFYQNFVGNYFRWWWFFSNFKTRFWKGSCTPAYIIISKWGENILRKIIIKPQFNYKRYSTSAQSMVCAESIAQISFATKKHTQNKDTMLIINMMYMNASPFGILISSVRREIPGPVYKVLTRLCYTLCSHCTVFAGFHLFTNKISSLFCQGLCWHFLPFPFKTEPSLLREFASKHYFTQNLYCTIQNILKCAMLG